MRQNHVIHVDLLNIFEVCIPRGRLIACIDDSAVGTALSLRLPG
jgi:hypothetical protein